MKTLPTTAEMQRAYLQRDASYNGLFYLAVRTTGVFCRPICPARKPLPKNVEYFATAGEALRAGYRPCKRCRPVQLDEQPAWVTRLLAEVENDPTAKISERDLAARGVDPATVRRYFQRNYGMTFQAYARAKRLSSALHLIREGAAVESVAFDGGFESPSGFRDAVQRVFGATPSELRHQPHVSLAWIRSPLGPLVAGATDQGACLLEFADRRMLEAQLRAVRRLHRAPLAPGVHDYLKQLEEELGEYFAGRRQRFDTPLDFRGTEFQQSVWRQLLLIPYGQCVSYEELAAAIGSPRAVRAVGRANGMNRLAIVIPCHRVIGKDGRLCGYGGGLHRKQHLLDLERGALAGGMPREVAGG